MYWNLLIPLYFLFLSFRGSLGQGYRTNFCPRLQAYQAGNYTNIENALQGMTLNIAYPPAGSTGYVVIDSNTNKPKDGFLYNLLTQASAIGKFSINWVPAPLQGSMKDDLYLQNMTYYFDTIARVTFDTDARRALGIGFFPPFLDASLQLIVNSNSYSTISSDTSLGWLGPFEYSLWGCLIVAIIWHGILQYLIAKTVNIKTLVKHLIDFVKLSSEENEASPTTVTPTSSAAFDSAFGPEDADEAISAIAESRKPFEDFIYKSFSTFTMSDFIEPTTRGSKMLLVVFGFFIVIFVASYTANLASSLVATSSVIIPIKSMSDANVQNAKVCFRVGGAAYTITSALYNNLQPVFTKATSNAEVLTKLQNGDCAAAVLTNNDWETVSQLVATNVGCNLVSLGSFQTEFVTLGYHVDHTLMCTSFMGDVLGSIFSDLLGQYTLQQDWATSLSSIREVDCSLGGALSSSSVVSSASSLSLSDLQGLFAFYAIVTAMIVFMHFALILFERYCKATVVSTGNSILKREGSIRATTPGKSSSSKSSKASSKSSKNFSPSSDGLSHRGSRKSPAANVTESDVDESPSLELQNIYQPVSNAEFSHIHLESSRDVHMEGEEMGGDRFEQEQQDSHVIRLRGRSRSTSEGDKINVNSNRKEGSTKLQDEGGGSSERCQVGNEPEHSNTTERDDSDDDDDDEEGSEEENDNQAWRYGGGATNDDEDGDEDEVEDEDDDGDEDEEADEDDVNDREEANVDDSNNQVEGHENTTSIMEGDLIANTDVRKGGEGEGEGEGEKGGKAVDQIN